MEQVHTTGGRCLCKFERNQAIQVEVIVFHFKKFDMCVHYNIALGGNCPMEGVITPSLGACSAPNFFTLLQHDPRTLPNSLSSQFRRIIFRLDCLKIDLNTPRHLYNRLQITIFFDIFCFFQHVKKVL